MKKFPSVISSGSLGLGTRVQCVHVYAYFVPTDLLVLICQSRQMACFVYFGLQDWFTRCKAEVSEFNQALL